MKCLSLFYHRNLRRGNKILWKRGKIAPKAPLFHNIFNMSLTSGIKLHNHLLNVVVRLIVFLTSATLIFRGTDISKCFRESLGIRDNESRLLYFRSFYFDQITHQKKKQILYNGGCPIILRRITLSLCMPLSKAPVLIFE